MQDLAKIDHEIAGSVPPLVAAGRQRLHRSVGTARESSELTLRMKKGLGCAYWRQSGDS